MTSKTGSIPFDKNGNGDGGADGVQPQISSEQVALMMANAQRMIEERKRQLAMNQIPVPVATIPTMGVPARARGMLDRGMGHPGRQSFTRMTTPDQQMSITIPPVVRQSESSTIGSSSRAPIFEGDKARKLSELREQINQKIASSGGFLPKILKEDGSVATGEDAAAAALPPTKPVPLLLDESGRAIDTTGKALLFPTHQPTLKANIRAQKRDRFGHHIDNKSVVPGDRSSTAFMDEAESNKYYDDRLAPVPLKSRSRGKKGLKFNEPGKFVSLAHRQRMQAQLARLQEEIAEKARTTGISTAARLARLSGAVASSTDKHQEYIPQMEWWDTLLLQDKDNNSSHNESLGYDCPMQDVSVSNLIEHPVQLRCPTDPVNPIYTPVYLTKKEMKKLRRQNRREAWKEKQEKVRLGLDPAPAPKVRMSNLMRVLGVEAVQDPTKIEAHVKRQMALRYKTHTEANLNRKLTPEQKKEKKIKKLTEDTTTGVMVAVYRIDDLSNQSKKFKVETNAKQLFLTGCILLYRECNVVVVEGGPKQQKKYKRLMMNRIKWTEDFVKGKEDTRNKCVVVWEGMTKARVFQDMKFKIVQTEEQARDYFKKHQVQHFWDLALSGTVLENVIDAI